MKKLFVLMALCVFMVTPALADEPIAGEADILCVVVNQDVAATGEPPLSDVLISLTTCNNQGPYILPATAEGELLGGVLWDSETDVKKVQLALLLQIDAGPPPTFNLIIDQAGTADCIFCP